MSKFVLLSTRIFAGGLDLSSQANRVELGAETEEADVTTFGSNGYREYVGGGMTSMTLAAGGPWEAGSAALVDDGLWSALGSTTQPWTVAPVDASVGSVAWVTRALATSQRSGAGEVGQVSSWEVDAAGTWPLARGVILHPAGTARTTTGSGTAVLHVATPTGKALYANLHVYSITGTTPSITVKVQSDDNSGFTTPTDRITFAAATAIGGQSDRVLGPITDTYLRATWTVSGTGPSVLFVVSAGIA